MRRTGALALLVMIAASCAGTRPQRGDGARRDGSGQRDLGSADRALVDGRAADQAGAVDQRPVDRSADRRSPDLRAPDLKPLPPDLPLGPTVGKLCTPGISSGCAAGESCAFITGTGSSTTQGYCTKHCPTLGAVCTGGPAGSLYYCALTGKSPTGQTVYACAFFCQLPGLNGTCPTTLFCSPTQQPAGSGQRPCLVAP